MRDREAKEAIHKKELEEITTLLEQHALVSKECESGPTMNALSSSNYELGFHLNNPYIPNEEEIIGMFDGGGNATNNEPIEEVDDVVVDRVGFKDVESALVTLNNVWNKDLLMLRLSTGAFKH